MVAKEYLQTLVAYNAWANGRVRRAVQACGPELYTREVGGSFPSLCATLVHIYGVERIWFQRLHGESPPGLVAAEAYPTLADLEEDWSRLEDAYFRWARELTEDAATRTCAYRDTRGREHANPVWQVVAHVVNHGSYHRGQVTNMLRALGGQPVATDMIAFFRQGP